MAFCIGEIRRFVGISREIDISIRIMTAPKPIASQAMSATSSHMNCYLFLWAVCWVSACATSSTPCTSVVFRSPPAHMTNVMREPFRVRQIRGRLTVPALEEWPSTVEFTFELRTPRSEALFVDVHRDGSFDAGPLETGTYCFRIWADGFQAYIGTIVIDQRARTDRIIEIAVKEGV